VLCFPQLLTPFATPGTSEPRFAAAVSSRLLYDFRECNTVSATRHLTTPSPPASLWRNPDFLLLWSGQVVSTVGTRVSAVAFPILALAISGSPTVAGLVGALASVPYFLLLLPAGAWVDRWDRKRVMVFCDLGRAAAMGSIPVALAAGSLTPVHLALVALADGTLSAFFDLAGASALPRIVDRPDLSRAISATSLADQASRLVGPALGGFLYVAGRALPFLSSGRGSRGSGRGRPGSCWRRYRWGCSGCGGSRCCDSWRSWSAG